jgi:cysteine desulfurase
MVRMIYLDANATEPLRPEARAAALAAMELVGNPSSVHAAGRAARRMLEDARSVVAARFGAAPAGVVFTSGGTEANALAISGCSQGRRVIVGATEHDAVRAAAPGAAVLPVSPAGQADLPALADLLRAAPALVCLMLANNETGVIHPMAEIAALCRAQGALLHVDAVQAAGRIDFTLGSLGADSLAISGHKLGGPKGAGALIMAPDLTLRPLIAGGGQERGRRGGTPALPAIAGLAAALQAATGASGLGHLRDRIEAACDATVCGGGDRLPNTSCLARPGQRADLQVIALDLAGIAVSAGAACSSGKVARSHVLDAMGLGELAGCAIRVSLPWNTTEADIDRFIDIYAAMGVAARERVPA